MIHASPMFLQPFDFSCGIWLEYIGDFAESGDGCLTICFRQGIQQAGRPYIADINHKVIYTVLITNLVEKVIQEILSILNVIKCWHVWLVSLVKPVLAIVFEQLPADWNPSLSMGDSFVIRRECTSPRVACTMHARVVKFRHGFIVNVDKEGIEINCRIDSRPECMNTTNDFITKTKCSSIPNVIARHVRVLAFVIFVVLSFIIVPIQFQYHDCHITVANLVPSLNGKSSEHSQTRVRNGGIGNVHTTHRFLIGRVIILSATTWISNSHV
mmetsp:Transcript_39941/g.96367  ORF Transcript_39941/g.96367 Transcript_39941/m.96367 type:complete len:270 (-) Transcript_39941:697-1506(-)